jgi:hypothetical protein
MASENRNVVFGRVEWEKYGQELQTNNVGANMIKGGLAAHVKSFPTIFTVHAGTLEKYTGNRSELSSVISE